MDASQHLDCRRLFDAESLTALTRDQVAHLDGCAACRHAYEARSRALGALANDVELPSRAQSEALLEGILQRALPVAKPRWSWRAVLLPSLAAAAAGVALLLLLPRVLEPGLGQVDDVPGGDFAARGETSDVQLGARAFCYEANTARRLLPSQTCPHNAAIAASVHLQQAGHWQAFLFVVDSAGDVHGAVYDEPVVPRDGVALRVVGHEEVLGAHVPLESVAPGRAQLVTVLCQSCTGDDVKGWLSRPPGPEFALPAKVLLERVAITVAGDAP